MFSLLSPIATHYFPSLYHNMYELEDGRTSSGGAVRYGFDTRTFPEFSWKGYAIFSKIQVRCFRIPEQYDKLMKTFEIWDVFFFSSHPATILIQDTAKHSEYATERTDICYSSQPKTREHNNTLLTGQSQAKAQTESEANISMGRL